MEHIEKYTLFESNSDILRKFVRFGKLGLVKQEGHGKDAFHAPPAPAGFYAMPYKFQELFLVSSMDKYQPKQLNMPKNDKFRDEEGNMDFDGMIKKQKERMAAIRHEFTIHPHTEFWHHLQVPRNEIIEQYGSWVKTNFNAWKKAIVKEQVKLRAQSLGSIFGSADKVAGRSINSVPKRTGYFSKDTFEVFFDTKIV